ncbi:hypothetical protein RQP46_010706 [Phenoliferia psychrophenolica]
MAATLPPEILDYILSLTQGPYTTWELDTKVGRPERENPNLALLCASLVNKTWSTSAQRALYRHAIFPTKPGYYTYTAWIESAARARHRTVSLWIRPSDARDFQRVLESNKTS